MNLVNRIFPPHFDNDYRGHKLALWFFGVIVFMRLGMSLSTIFNGHETAISADGIPLEHLYACWSADGGFYFRAVGAGCVRDLLAVYIGPSSLSQHGPGDVCSALIAILGRKIDSLVSPVCQDRDAARLLRQLGSPRLDDHWPSPVAVAPNYTVEPTAIRRRGWRFSLTNRWSQSQLLTSCRDSRL